ncbi:MAG: hypothetical protein BWY54_00665 [Candidatus Dependentiae bacterium ADurb.Bin331]|nr:MAG: hypothetical protein BWY54_00665 [Candidatus Dependentiae bacterium ADurb.Bin331]
MPVLLGVNKLCAFVAPYSPIVRYLLTSFILLTMLCVWYKGPYQWLTNYKQHIDTEMVQIQKVIQASAQDEHLLKTLHASCSSLKREIKELGYLTNKQSTDCLFSILSCAQINGLTVESCANQYEKDKVWCTKKGFSYAFKGDFRQFFNFLNALAAHKTMVRCKEFFIEKYQDKLRAQVVFETIIIKDEAYA